MARVLGIGGVFFKSRDPKKLQEWYVENLGFKPEDEGVVIFKWSELGKVKRRAYTLWGPFPDDTKYFEPSKASSMINFVVDDLDGMLESLRSKGVDVDKHIEEHQEGRFGWIVDPEGNKIELWEPPEEARS
ncbi:MAG: VOC family protein [Candidatus Thorarchaeota archaeon]|jgi:predicted enzyme related to lactoylglutathione lyase